MKVLLIGNGGREHALAWKLSQSPLMPELYFAAGNPGMRSLGQSIDIENTNIDGLLDFAKQQSIDLTVVGPELPLSLGLADCFRETGLKVFGPVSAGAQMESSKAFAKQLMRRHGIPTAEYRACQEEKEALAALDFFQAPYVIKEDGLAAGKGVTIASSREEAESAIHQAFQKNMPVVIEEFMQGEELSVLAFCDGKTILPCIAAQDYKKALDGNQGPNTGGMGAYAPVPIATSELMARIESEILQPTLQAMQAEGIHYQGILYAGLMITPEGKPKVVEFNVRFGDPETQVVLPLLDEDLLSLMLATVDGELHRHGLSPSRHSDLTTGHYSDETQPSLRFLSNRHAVTVVLTSAGYPAAYAKGKEIILPDSHESDAFIFHAGTGLKDNTFCTDGGRVLNVTAWGGSLEVARKSAYDLVAQIQFDGKTFRRDIGLCKIRTNR